VWECVDVLLELWWFSLTTGETSVAISTVLFALKRKLGRSWVVAYENMAILFVNDPGDPGNRHFGATAFANAYLACDAGRSVIARLC